MTKLFRGVTVKETEKKKNVRYNPNLGFIGNSEVKVSNYLFSGKRLRKAYQHAEPITSKLLSKNISNHYIESKKLTKFLKNRDLTFSKKTEAGEYKTFTVPCTTTIVPMEKSLFNEIETAAQKLMISLRGVIQDIYGSESLEASPFINSLPKDVRLIFIEAIKSSSNYFPQLHHKNMRDYPFLDNVGLDLVLVEDYIQKSNSFPKIIAKNKENELPGLPFRILEINAGSPSGASNNMNVLQGLYDQAPDMVESLGKVMPNDHFKVLGETYKSLGENWTGITDGVQVLLPPGGQNGAAPEIHQLAAYSGLIYTDADQLYQDNDGHIRLRTVGKENPIVTAIYSRINADSALFDIKKNLLLKDPDSAEPLYLKDNLILDEEGEGKVMLDESGKPIPQQSSYAIPGIIDAIINKKIYMGGLNRILDNKIILATLTHYAPKYFAHKIKEAGLSPKGAKILPPQTLPPTLNSAEIIAKNPDEWVVKAPSLAGGQGVYILKTLPQNKKDEIIREILKNPKEYAYQQLVKIARIPVAVQRKEEGFKFANLAADIRTWVFFGGDKNALPKMTHNALVRYAPQEKGKMSSIVNTSAGGGYAPFIILDDTQKEGVSVKELVKEFQPIVKDVHLPVFVAAQIIQISRMLQEAKRHLEKEDVYAFEFLNLMYGLKYQLKEIVSFLHPRSISHIYQIIDLLEIKVSKKEVKDHFNFISKNQLHIVDSLKRLESSKVLKEIRDHLDNIRALNTDVVTLNYSPEDKSLDLVILSELKELMTSIRSEDKTHLTKLIKHIQIAIDYGKTEVTLRKITKKRIRKHLENFCSQSANTLKQSPKRAHFAELFSLQPNVTRLQFETLYLGKKDSDLAIKVGTQFEYRTNKSIISSDFLDSEILRAQKEWKKIEALGSSLDISALDTFLETKRVTHLGRFPKLAKMQQIINKKDHSIDELIELMDVVPYAKFNIENFAKEQGLSVKEIFSTTLKKNRISILTTKQLQKRKLANREHAGECFAKKKKAHGLYSDSDIYIWIRAELDAFTKLYTIGHELIHYQQIKQSMAAEKRALKDGDVSLAKFLNYYGNFLGANHRSVEKIEFDLHSKRIPLYGYADRIHNKEENEVIIKNLNDAIRVSDTAWDEEVKKYGSLFGYMMPNSTGTRVKALQEVLPALENAKNIIFAKSIGLFITADPITSALPTANNKQREYYKEEIITAVKATSPEWEALRIIASHQYHGVSFFRADREENNLTLRPIVGKVAIGSSYNQTQQ